MADRLSTTALPESPIPGRGRGLFATLQERPPLLRAILWQLGAAAAISTMAALIKTVGQDMSVAGIIFFRWILGFLLLLPVAVVFSRHRRDFANLKPSRPGLVALRAILSFLASLFLFYAVARLPLTTVSLFGFTKVIFVIPLGAFFLGDPAGWRHWLAALLGLVGVGLVVHPAAATSSVGVAAALAAASLTASGAITVRAISAHASPLTTTLWIAALTALLALPLAPYAVEAENRHYGLLAGIAVCGVLTQFCNFMSYRNADVGSLAPWGCLRVVMASFYGYILFAEVPDAFTVAGGALILFASLWLTRFCLRKAPHETGSGRKRREALPGNGEAPERRRPPKT